MVDSVKSSIAWKFFERGSVQVTQFVVSIIIARLLLPADYGAIALITIFISVATVFVQSGLNTALIQKKNADLLDSFSVFYCSLGLASTIYTFLYVCAPWIADFYKMPELISLLRVLSLILFPGALNAIQIAVLSKLMQFKKQLYSSLLAAVISGTLGIVLAYEGYGAWALVYQQLSYQTIICIVLWFLVKWRPQLMFSLVRAKSLFAYGVKLLVARLIDTIYHNLESLIIGKAFSAETLAYCNKGKQFPLTLIDNIDGSVQSVMLPAYAAKQDDLAAVKNMLRRTISISTFLVFPSMIMLAVVASPMIELLLGKNWLSCVPYVQLFCFIAMVFPLQTANLQAINAIGRSDVYLKLMALKRFIGVAILLSSVFIYRSPFAVVISALLVEFIAVIVNVPSNRKLLNYTFTELIKDTYPSLLVAIISGLIALSCLKLNLNCFLMILLQMIMYLLWYVGISFAIKSESLTYIMNLIKIKK